MKISGKQYLLFPLDAYRIDSASKPQQPPKEKGQPPQVRQLSFLNILFGVDDENL